MPILTSQFNDLVKNALVQWREEYEGVEKAARMLYDITPNENLTSEHSHIDSPGFAKRKDEGDQYAVGSPRQGYTLNLTKSRIGLKDSVTWEMRKYDKYREIEKKMRGLGESTAMRIELDLTHLFSFGFAGSYTNMDGETVNCVTGDGNPIFYDTHSITGSATTVDNENGTLAFNRTSLESAERLFRNMVNMNDVKVVPKPDTIITGDDPAITNVVAEFMRSVSAPDTAERSDNVYKGKYKHLVLPLLATTNLGAPTSTGRYFWFLADTKHKDALLEFSEMPTFQAPNPGSNGEDFDTDDWKFKSSASYAYGVLDYKWIVGSAATTI
ncbi:MAG: hypothetical protein NUV80_04645 [Candidatus Berkelbacteria bacterium]|nr:hypothetical protein [Candidatus Berkelbacteria bacterium]